VIPDNRNFSSIPEQRPGTSPFVWLKGPESKKITVSETTAPPSSKDFVVELAKLWDMSMDPSGMY